MKANMTEDNDHISVLMSLDDFNEGRDSNTVLERMDLWIMQSVTKVGMLSTTKEAFEWDKSGILQLA